MNGLPPRAGRCLDAHSLDAHWLAEALRLREEHWGPLEDAREVREARARARTPADRILLRARLLGERSGLAGTVRRWRRAAAATLAGALLLALLAGAGAALGALGDGSRPVNIAWSLGALLGVHAATFALWLASLGWRGSGASGLGGLWLWAARRLARGPDAALAPQALTGLLARHGALRWVLGAVANGLWLAALLASLAALLAALSTRRYGFAWETTILQPQRFVELTAALGWLPAKLGFAVPDAATVLASDGVQAPPPGAQALWASWLAGAVAVYGVAPRLAAFALCGALAWRAVRGMRLDPGLPGYAALRDRLSPPSERLGPDGGEPGPAAPRLRRPAGGAAGEGSAARGTAGPGGAAGQDGPAGMAILAGVELPADLPWPPPGLPAGVRCEPVIDTREQRSALLESLLRRQPARLLIACDARQTPDRGTLALIVELADRAAAARIWLVQGEEAPRAALWRRRLAEAGLDGAAVGADAPALFAWLETGNG